ncbi:hypothetical protein RCC89_04275 [Cytophagaceae bacterium ABcell3]|nr:hypothetical protein RCC89_04275 [Cytophagaceae bacterium ABcell3]
MFSRSCQLVLASLLFLIFLNERAVGQQFHVFNEGESFSCIAVDSLGNIWSGTDKSGLFKLADGSEGGGAFSLVPIVDGNRGLEDHLISSIAADGNQNLWVAYTDAGGGINKVDNSSHSFVRFSVDRNQECFPNSDNFGEGLPTINPNHLTVDKNNTVWGAFRYHDIFVPGVGTLPSEYYVYPGSMAYIREGEDRFTSISVYQDYLDGNEVEDYFPYPANNCNPGMEMAQTRNCQSVSSNNEEVWLSVFPYTGKNGVFNPSRIIRFDLDANYLGEYAFADVGISGGIFNAMYVGDEKQWVSTSFAGNGFAVRENGNWTAVLPEDLSCMLPEDIRVNDNAIWGNAHGNVFIGTNKGLLVYDGRGEVKDPSSYTFFTTENSALPSNNIVGGTSQDNTVQWIATDNGIVQVSMGHFPSDEVDPSDCGEEDIDLIMAQDHDYLRENDRSFHDYTVTTEICDLNSDNEYKVPCTVENVYKLMKENVALTAPTPEYFTHDNFSPVLLSTLSSSGLDDIVERVNNWEPQVTEENPTGRIRNVNDVLSFLQRQRNVEVVDVPAMFRGLYKTEQMDLALMELQAEENPKSVVPCHKYKLYNNTNMIIRRSMYERTLDSWFCGGNLHSKDYDEIYAFPDDHNYSITNFTANGHFLYPGKVVRKVVNECGKVKVISRGVGVQYCGDSRTGQINANGNVVIGSILFKNIDLRLIKAFEEQE